MDYFADLKDDLPFETESEGRPLQSAMRGSFTSFADVCTFIEAGNATLTVVSRKTGTRFTFKFQRPDPQPGRDRPIWVKLLAGADNTSDYEFLGTIWTGANGYSYRHSAKSRTGASAPSVRAVQWLLKSLNIGDIASMEIWHEGRCGRCGRKLTVPSSIESGFGPECINNL